MGNYAEHLRRATMFEGLDDLTLNQVSQGCRRLTLKEDETLFHEGDGGGTMFIILSGRIALERFNSRGQQLLIAYRASGEVIGEFTVFDEGKRNANARALETTELLALHGDHLLHCLNRNPALALGMIRILVGKLRQATDRSASGLGDSVRQRLAKELVAEIQRCGEKQSDGSWLIPTKLTQQHLANLTGCTRETASRTLAQFRDEGVLARTSTPIVVASLKHLERIAKEQYDIPGVGTFTG